MATRMALDSSAYYGERRRTDLRAIRVRYGNEVTNASIPIHTSRFGVLYRVGNQKTPGWRCDVCRKHPVEGARYASAEDNNDMCGACVAKDKDNRARNIATMEAEIAALQRQIVLMRAAEEVEAAAARGGAGGDEEEA